MESLEAKNIPVEIVDIEENGDKLKFTQLQTKIEGQENQEKSYFELMESVLLLEETADSDLSNYNMERVNITIDHKRMAIKPVI